MKHWMQLVSKLVLVTAVAMGCQSPATPSANGLGRFNSSDEIQSLGVLLADQAASESGNLALGQPVNASGFDEGFSFEFVADGLYDPLLTPPQCWRMSQGAPNWVEIRLAGKARIEQVELMLGPGAEGTPFDVWARFADGRFEMVGNFDTKPDSLGVIAAILPKPQEGVTDVRIGMLDPGFPCIHEIRIFGAIDEVIPQPPGLLPHVAIVGPEEVVFDWSTDRCNPHDFPDLPVRAFVDAEGQVQMIRSGPSNRRLVGPDLNNVRVEGDCHVILESLRDREPSHYQNEQWIQTVYAEDGNFVHAFLHNEQNDVSQRTWYQNLTYAFSQDGGNSYQQPEPPTNLVASSPYPYTIPNGLVHGLTGGSNIIKGPDGAYYMTLQNDLIGQNGNRTCLARSTNLRDPASWLAWRWPTDQEHRDHPEIPGYFDEPFINPYISTEPPSEEDECKPIFPTMTTPDGIPIYEVFNSLTHNTFARSYMLLGYSYPDGIYYRFSDNLIGWSERQLLYEVPNMGGFGPGGGPDSINYPTLLDPESGTRNFETADQTFYIYYLRANYESGTTTFDWDLVRFPVELTRSAEDALAVDARTKLQVSATSGGGDRVDLDGSLDTLGGTPLSFADITFYAIPADGEGLLHTYTVEETVPAAATQARVGIRIGNWECGPRCGDNGSQFYLHGFRYSENGGPELNPDSYGYTNAPLWTAEAPVGQHPVTGETVLHLTADPGEWFSTHSAKAFPVTAGANFALTVKAQVWPGSQYSGYFAIFFQDSSGNEVMRAIIPVRPVEIELATVSTDDDGNFSSTVTLPGSGSWHIEARFDGSDRYWHAEGESTVWR